MNDFPDNSDIAETVMYADDSTEVVVDDDPEELQLKLQLQATSSTQWIRR